MAKKKVQKVKVELNANELKVLKALADNSLHESGGAFALPKYMKAIPGVNKVALNGYFVDLGNKEMLESYITPVNDEYITQIVLTPEAWVLLGYDANTGH